MDDTINLIIKDIQNLYRNYRIRGDGRNNAISRIKEQYVAELQDADDQFAVVLGIALSLCERKELTAEIVIEALQQIQKYRQTNTLDQNMERFLSKVEAKLQDPSMQGDEATYHRRSLYSPDWNVGDLFKHTITCPDAVLHGILGWSILFYKIGEITDDCGFSRHLMYVTLCPPDQEPKSSAELQKLGFLRMMNYGDQADYMVQICVKSKREEASYEFAKIGNFLGITAPADCKEENPLVSMPVFGKFKSTSEYPSYEKQICMLYKKHKAFLPYRYT